MKSDTERTGKCLCGAVSYAAKGVKPELSACHCGMCRRWTGGPYLGLTATEAAWKGSDKIATYKSSDWAKRAFCSVCGSALYYVVTAPGPHQGQIHLAFGTLDDQSGFDLELEWFIDKKPDAYALAGEHKLVTEAEVMAMFGEGGS